MDTAHVKLALFRILNITIIVILALSTTGNALAEGEPAPFSLNIRAYIDGYSQLVIQGSNVYWHHIGAAAPGRWLFVNEPTYLNGTEWYPTWPDESDAENRDCNCYTKDKFSLDSPLPEGQSFVLNLIQARYSAHISQQPNAGNKYTLIIDFDDGPPGGAEWYEVEVAAASFAPWLIALPENDAVEGWEWPEGATVTLTINHTTDPDWSGVANVTTWGDPRTYVRIEFGADYNLQIGDVVELTDGINTITHTVKNLSVIDVNQDDEFIGGTADAGETVNVWPHGHDQEATVPATTLEDGSWQASFKDLFDLVIGTCGRSQVTDPYGNATAVDWCAPKPWFAVFPEWDVYVQAFDYPLGTNVHLAIDDPATKELNPDFEADQMTEVTSWNQNGAWAVFNLHPYFDVKPGDIVKLTSAGITPRVHIVQKLAIAKIDRENNLIEGTADPGAKVYVWPFATWQKQQTMANSEGVWQVDFMDVFTLVPDECGRAEIHDDKGNVTALDWCVPWPPSTFIVNTTDDNDDGTCDEVHCSLREALNTSNARIVPDTITFNISGDTPYTIQPRSPLPNINDPVIIDGTTQPGYAGAPIIELDGTYAGDWVTGLVIATNDTTVKGLAINRYKGHGLVINGNRNIVQGNYIGPDVTGTTYTGPAGLSPDSYTVSIDTACPAYPVGTNFDGFISASENPLAPWSGISVQFKGTDTDKCGSPETFGSASLIYRYKLEFDETTPLTSIVVSGAAFNGPDSVLRVLDENKNVLGTAYTFGGNSFQTPYIMLPGVEGTVFYVEEYDTSTTWRFRQNIIVNGSLPLGNFGNGVQISGGASDNLVGGPDPADRNLISGNGSEGIGIYDNGTNNNIIQGNFIGTDVTGTQALPNSLRGIFIVGGPADNVVEANLVSGNRFSGVNITAADHTLVQGNKIGTNFDGTAAIGNFGNGVVVDGGATGNVIGGANPDTMNLISGNFASGVWVFGPGTTGNLVQGNYIGTDITGTTTTSSTTGPEIGKPTLTVMPETCRTYDSGTERDGFISESNDPLAPWSGTSVTFMGTDEGKCGIPETFEGSALIYRYMLVFDEPTELASIAVSGAAFNGGALRVLDENKNVLGTAYNFGGNSFQTNIVRLSNVVGRVFYVEEYDSSSDWRFRQSIVINGPLPLGNNASGIAIGDQASDNLIIENLVSGNRSDGIALFNSGTSGNILQGNSIGTNISGTAALPNAGAGLWIGEGASNTLVGGVAEGEGNLISGNANHGISINHLETTGTRVLGNYIGTNRSGEAALPNGAGGVFISASQTQIGGTEPRAGNLISGNRGDGLHVTESAAGNIIRGNFIGTDSSGTLPLGNWYSGIYLSVGTTGNSTGGTEPGAGNIIAFNGGYGIATSFEAGQGNAILSNSVFSNGGLGIDLGTDYITRNDRLDQDTGPNNLQNFPIITAVKRLGATVTIQGLLPSTPQTTFRVEFFSNQTCDSSVSGEGQTFIGFVVAKTNPAGIAHFEITLPVSLPQGAFVTATATDPAGNTSEFSKCFTPAPGWNQVNDSGFGSPATSGVSALETFQGQLYAGASNWETGGQIWRLGQDGLWLQVNEAGFGGEGANPAIIDLAIFQDQLYASTGWGGTLGQVWRSANGTNWQPVTKDGFGEAENSAITSFTVFKNVLYAGTGSSTTSAQIWRSSTGKSGSWKQVAPDGPGLAGNITGFAIYKNILYAAVEPAGGLGAPIQVWRSVDGSAWTTVVPDGFGDGNNVSTGGFAQFGGYLYLGTRNDTTGAQLWRTNDGIHWVQVVSNGFGDLNNIKIEMLLVYNDFLYAATYNWTGLQVWRSANGLKWEQLTANGFGDSGNSSTLWNSATVVYQGQLVIGTWNSNDGGEVWKFTP